jgi:hypothetical protein
VTSYYVVYLRPDGTLGKRTFPNRDKASRFAWGYPSSLVLQVRGGRLVMVDMFKPDAPRDGDGPWVRALGRRP